MEQSIDIKENLQESYMDYAMSVIVGRAIPDARDGLKPVQRRILYACYELGFTHTRPYRKCARIVGDVIGKYHPHGDAAVYEALVRMAQDFSLRYPLIDGQGNFGSIDGDPPAAMRYTEARLLSIAEEMLKDLDKDTVDFRPNYDGTLKEPVILPSSLPNLLINGSSGIAVGYSCNIPPHNLREVIDATVFYIERRGEVENQELMKFIKGPDFPTGGIIVGRNGIRDAYCTGNGRIKVRAKVKVEKEEGRKRIVIYEIPYSVNKSVLVQSIADLIKENRIEGVLDLRDESSKEGIRVVIEPKKGENISVLLNRLYKFTSLETTFGIHMLALDKEVPKLLTLKDLIGIFVEHRKICVTRRTEFLLRKVEERAHILEGLEIACNNIEEVVKIIKSSKTTLEAKERLRTKFAFSVLQVQAILDMKLSRLVSLERKKIQEEHASLLKDIAYYRKVLSREDELYKVITGELLDIKERYGDDRRTWIEESERDLNLEDIVKPEKVVITCTQKNYVKRIPASSFIPQARGGKGRKEVLRTDDVNRVVVSANNLDLLYFFTNYGRVFTLKAYLIPEATFYSKGRSVSTMVNLQEGEEIRAIVPLGEEKSPYFVFITEQGIIKKTKVSLLCGGKSGKIALSLKKGDFVVKVFNMDKGDIIVSTYRGFLGRFDVGDVREMGRSAKGVIGMRLMDEDKVVSACRGYENVILVTEKGYGKKISIDEIRKTHRGSRGVKGTNVEKGGYVVEVLPDVKGKNLIILTNKGRVIRIDTKDVKKLSRAALGVKLQRLEEGDKIVGVSLV
ncbi:MAG: DNA gyrase subunit A [Deltaproteobacteria bacterium]|nr:DNA gyrase subunit A [Deltaproteobacteria bacterium]